MVYKCPECGDEFKSSQALGSHITYQHRRKDDEFQKEVTKVKAFIEDNPGAKEYLERILQIEDELQRDFDEKGVKFFLGWSREEVAVPKPELEPMLTSGIIRLQYESHRYKNYALVNREATREALRQLEEEIEEEPGEIKIPDDFLDIVELRLDEKDLIITALMSPQPVHVLMVGPPASAKSLILREIKRTFPAKSRFTTGGAVSKAGLVDYLIVHRPRILLLDEVDYLRGEDQPALLSLMEDGIVTRLKYGKRDTVYLKTWVFAGCNRANGLVDALMSRFFTIRLEPYNKAEFKMVAEAVLCRREGLPEDLARHIAQELSEFTCDIRDAVKIGRLAVGSGLDINRIKPFIRMMKYGQRVGGQYDRK